jgi:type II secretory ATPase GspE/PulE/Tfp pilus assembly ATPase PilB-like protein
MELNVRPEDGHGCVGCNGTGYRGRVGIFGLLVKDDRTKLAQAFCRCGCLTDISP